MASRGIGIGVAPQRFTPSTLGAGAVSYMTTRQETPSFLATYAQAWAALPALTVIKPRRRGCAGPRSLPIIVGMPIYEYLCAKCGRRSSALLTSFSSPDPACPYCG